MRKETLANEIAQEEEEQEVDNPSALPNEKSSEYCHSYKQPGVDSRAIELGGWIELKEMNRS